MTFPIKHTRGDAMDAFVVLRGEEALARLMGVHKAKPPKLPKMGKKVNKAHSTEKRDEVLKLIETAGPLTRKELERMTGFSNPSIDYAISVLFQNELIEKVDPDAKQHVKWRTAE